MLLAFNQFNPLPGICKASRDFLHDVLADFDENHQKTLGLIPNFIHPQLPLLYISSEGNFKHKVLLSKVVLQIFG